MPLDANRASPALAVTDLRYGTYLVTAQYSGDGGFGPAVDSVTQDVNATGTSATLTVDPVAPTVDDVVTLTATVTATTATRTPSGTVTFLDDGVPIGSAVTVDGNGIATYHRTFDRAVHTLTASFTGSPGWGASSASAVTVTPARAP